MKREDRFYDTEGNIRLPREGELAYAANYYPRDGAITVVHGKVHIPRTGRTFSSGAFLVPVDHEGPVNLRKDRLTHSDALSWYKTGEAAREALERKLRRRLGELETDVENIRKALGVADITGAK